MKQENMTNPGPEPVSLIVQGAWVLTMNREHQVFSPGAVALKGAGDCRGGAPGGAQSSATPRPRCWITPRG